MPFIHEVLLKFKQLETGICDISNSVGKNKSAKAGDRKNPFPNTKINGGYISITYIHSHYSKCSHQAIIMTNDNCSINHIPRNKLDENIIETAFFIWNYILMPFCQEEMGEQAYTGRWSP